MALTQVPPAMATPVNTANGFVQLDGSTKLPVIDGSQLTGITASQVSNLPSAPDYLLLNQGII